MENIKTTENNFDTPPPKSVNNYQQTNSASDSELVLKIQKFNDEESLKTIISRHSPLCTELYKRFKNKLVSSGVYVEDVVGERDYVFYKAALDYDPTRGMKFSTFLGERIKFQCLNAINRNRKHSEHTFEPINNDEEHDYLSNLSGPPPEDTGKQDLMAKVIELSKEEPDKRIGIVFELRYGNGKKKSWREIGFAINASRQTPLNLHEKFIKDVKKRLDKKEYVG